MRIAFFGNTCTGKTSSMYALAKLLTEEGRSFRLQNMPYDNSGHVKNVEPFPAQDLEVSPEARLHFIHDHLAEQYKFITESSVDYLISEMSIYDLMFFYNWVCWRHNVTPQLSVAHMCADFMKTYDLVYYMPNSKYYRPVGGRPETNWIQKALSDGYQGCDIKSLNSNIVEIAEQNVENRWMVVQSHFKENYL